MCVCVYTYIYIYIYIHIHTYTYIHIHTYKKPYIHTHIHTHIYKHIQEFMYTEAIKQLYDCSRSPCGPYRDEEHIRCRTYTYIHTYIHIQKLSDNCTIVLDRPVGLTETKGTSSTYAVKKVKLLSKCFICTHMLVYLTDVFVRM